MVCFNMDRLVLSFIISAFWLHYCRGETGYFWHVTDYHYDFTYYGDQLSCADDRRPNNPGPFGDFWCDSPWRLVNSSVQAMVYIKGDVDFILWSGDTVLHAEVEELSYDINAEILDNVTELFMTSFPDTPVYSTLGNNDYWPDDQFPPHNNKLYNATVDRWRNWINDPTQDKHIRKGGYYSVQIKANLLLLCLNTNLYYRSNQQVANVSDPGEQFTWLRAELTKAETNNNKVMITAHIPPGVTSGRVWWQQHFHDEFVLILRRYTHVITGMHFGHHHIDTFRLLYNLNKTSATPIFIAPSVTPWRYVTPTLTGPAHNPGVRLVSYDRQTGKQEAISQYFLDFQKANNEGRGEWRLEYNTSSVYGLPDLTTRSLENLIGKMKTKSGPEFKNYWKFYSVSPSDDLLDTCDTDCHASEICGFSEYTIDSYDHCKKDMVTSSTEMVSPSFILVHVTYCLGVVHYHWLSDYLR